MTSLHAIESSRQYLHRLPPGYEIQTHEVDTHFLYRGHLPLGNFRHREEAIRAAIFDAGAMDERRRWQWVAGALFVVAVIGWVL